MKKLCYEFLLVGALVVAPSSWGNVADESAELAASLAKVNARCPKDYPRVVTPLPEPGELSDKSETELLAMITTWSPALRNAASSELAFRGDSVLPALSALLADDDWQKREASAKVLARAIRHKVRNWQEAFPDEANWREGQAKVRAQYAELIPLALPLFKESERSVRAAGLGLICEIGAGNAAATEAVLSLFGDPDEYLAQDAMKGLAKNVGLNGVDEDLVYTAFAKGFKQPLPWGKGAVVSLIGKQDEAFRKRCVPLLLQHLAWVPRRDTMFGSSGQKEAIKILTELRDPTFVPQLKSVMYKKYKDRYEYLDAVVAAAAEFGTAASELLPTLNEELAQTEKDLAQIEEQGISRRNKTRFEQLKNRRMLLKKAVTNVQK